jgi:hypothetical protein
MRRKKVLFSSDETFPGLMRMMMDHLEQVPKDLSGFSLRVRR